MPRRRAKRSRADWTDDDRAAIQAAIDECVPTGQTGVLRDNLLAAIEEIKRRRADNTRLGGLLFNALHDDSGSWPAVEYMTGVSRGRAKRWGDLVIQDDC